MAKKQYFNNRRYWELATTRDIYMTFGKSEEAINLRTGEVRLAHRLDYICDFLSLDGETSALIDMHFAQSSPSRTTEERRPDYEAGEQGPANGLDISEISTPRQLKRDLETALKRLKRSSKPEPEPCKLYGRVIPCK